MTEPTHLAPPSVTAASAGAEAPERPDLSSSLPPVQPGPATGPPDPPPHPRRGRLAMGLALAGVSVYLLGWALMAAALGSMTGSEGDLGVLGVGILVEGIGTLVMFGLGVAAIVAGARAILRAAAASEKATWPLIAVILGAADVVVAVVSPVGSVAGS
jgi:hypothetical protein